MGWVGQGRWGVEEERKGSGKTKRKRGERRREGAISREGKAW